MVRDAWAELVGSSRWTPLVGDAPGREAPSFDLSRPALTMACATYPAYRETYSAHVPRG